MEGHNAQDAVNVKRAGIEQLPEAVAADAGYWTEQHMDEVVAHAHILVLIPPDKGSRGTSRPTWTGGRYERMRRLLSTELGQRLYRTRSQTVEPLFGDTKHNKGRLPIPPARRGQGAHRVAID